MNPTRNIIKLNISQINKLPMIYEGCENCSSIFICSRCSKQLDNLCIVVDNYINSAINDIYDSDSIDSQSFCTKYDEISSIKLNDNSILDISNNIIETNLDGKIILRECTCKCKFECRCFYTELLHKKVIKNVNTLKFISQNLSSEFL